MVDKYENILKHEIKYGMNHEKENPNMNQHIFLYLVKSVKHVWNCYKMPKPSLRTAMSTRGPAKARAPVRGGGGNAQRGRSPYACGGVSPNTHLTTM